MTRYTILIIFLCVLFKLSAQNGGDNTYEFLNLTHSAKLSALGGVNVSLNDNDLNLVENNPALLSLNNNNQVALNYINYFTDINYSHAAYAKSFNKLGTFAASLRYINYGTFKETNEKDEFLGNFTANEYAINVSWSKKIDSSFTFGASWKHIYSDLYKDYNSYGTAIDAGILYNNPKHLFSAGMVLKNIGIQVTKYNQERESLPLDLQIGMTKKLAHAPFRFSVTAINLITYDLMYEKPESGKSLIETDSEAQSKTAKVGDFFDNLMRHVVVGAEFTPFKSFYAAFGYNYKRRQELTIETRPFMVGFSWGMGLNLPKFRLSYGRSTYHLAGATNHFSLLINLNEFYQK